ncbi:MAG: hypothetical protein WCK67_00555 [bacterium]
MQKKSYEELKEWLKKKKFQKRIDELAKKYKDKKVLIYGAGLLSSVIFDDYDLSNLDIIGVSDKRFYSGEETYRNFNAIPPDEIEDLTPDAIIMATYHTFDVKNFLENYVGLESNKNIKLEPMVKKNIKEKIEEFLFDVSVSA